MEPCDTAFDIENWREVPVIEHRVATDADIRACIAAFTTGPGQSEPFEGLALPARARLLTAMPDRAAGADLVVVQIERAIGQDMVVVGFIFPDGSFGVSLLSDIQIVETAR